MSDRRPEKLYVNRLPCQALGCAEDHWPIGTKPASSADLISAVRRGVESGTIKGEVVDAAWGSRNPRSDAGWTVLTGVENPGTYYIIPVSDGGSET